MKRLFFKRYAILASVIIASAAGIWLYLNNTAETEAEKIILNKDRLIFHYDTEETQQIKAEIVPSKLGESSLSYASRDKSIADVDENGLVAALGNLGETVIDVSCGDLSAEVKVSVVKGVEGIELSQSAISLYADRSSHTHIDAVIYPDDAGIKEVSWHSSDESVVHVDSGGNVYPCGAGTAQIYAVTEDGGYKAECSVNVCVFEKTQHSIKTAYTDYEITLYDMVMEQMSSAPASYDTSAGRSSDADKLFSNDEEVEGFAKPDNFINGYDKFQFMVLNEANGISARELDAYLVGKGELEGKGELFLRAAEDNGMSELFLVLLACIETENGCSALAKGMEINGKTVYNPLGLGDASAGTERGGWFAYEQGWTDIDSAILNGAKWISENYINNENYKQNTLYKMRWNPDDPSEHQYTRDVAWAVNLARKIGAMAESFPSAQYSFDIARFKEGKTVAG